MSGEKCEEHAHKINSLEVVVRETDENVKEIKKILIGNGKIGVAEMARRSFEFMKFHDKTKNGRLDWTFRIIVGMVLSFIALKVGLK